MIRNFIGLEDYKNTSNYLQSNPLPHLFRNRFIHPAYGARKFFTAYCIILENIHIHINIHFAQKVVFQPLACYVGIIFSEGLLLVVI